MPKSSSRRGVSRRSTESAAAPVTGSSGEEIVAEPDTAAVPAPAGRRRRQRDVAAARPPGQSSPWVPALMVSCFVLGLIWLVVYYLAGTQVPGMSALGNWNLLVGVGVIAVGFVVSTQWR